MHLLSFFLFIVLSFILCFFFLSFIPSFCLSVIISFILSFLQSGYLAFFLSLNISFFLSVFLSFLNVSSFFHSFSLSCIAHFFLPHFLSFFYSTFQSFSRPVLKLFPAFYHFSFQSSISLFNLSLFHFSHKLSQIFHFFLPFMVCAWPCLQRANCFVEDITWFHSQLSHRGISQNPGHFVVDVRSQLQGWVIIVVGPRSDAVDHS